MFVTNHSFKNSTKPSSKFCGYVVCENCSLKKRKDPKGKDFHPICDMCDEKYLRMRINQEYKMEQLKSDIEIQKFELQLRDLKKVYSEKMKVFEKLKSEVTQKNNRQIAEHGFGYFFQ